MSKSRHSIGSYGLLALLLLPTGAVGAELGDRHPASAWWCGTYDLGIEEALARHEWNRRRLRRGFAAQSTADQPPAMQGPAVRRVGGVAVIEDDGTLVASRNLFDFEERGVRFLRKRRNGFRVKTLGGAVNPDLGDKLPLGDDDAVRVDFPGFRVRFHGRRYASVYVNSDGNLTFGEPDRASTSRDVPRLLNGPPRIAPFFADLNPATAQGDGGVYVRFSGSTMTVTWWRVPEYGEFNNNTFQVTLVANGRIDMRFGRVDAQEGIVGVGPGGGGGLELIDLTQDLPIKRFGVAIAERFKASETVDEASVANVFFQHFADDYDQLVLFTDFGGLVDGAIAYHLTIRNQVRGIGAAVYDGSRFFGSRGRLEGFVNMGGMSKYRANIRRIDFLGVYSALDILAHEIGHQWLVSATFIDANGQVSDDLLGRGNAHWSFYFDSDASFLEGNEILDNGDGTFTTLSQRASYNLLDLYLMGLVPAREVPDKFYVALASGPEPDVAAPEFGVTFTGQRVDVTMDQILASLGTRRPSVENSPKNFNIGFILLAKDGQRASQTSIDKVNQFAEEIEGLFRRSTGRRARIDSALVAN